MSDPSLYWTFYALAANGQARQRQLPEAKALLQALAPNFTQASAERKLQRTLLEKFQTDTPEGDIAGLCLRCYISYQIFHTCLKLARDYGQNRDFSEPDLFPYVLNDNGKLQPGDFQPFSLKILATFDPAKGKLNTWASMLTEQHPPLNRFLNQQGVYIASRWSLLNHISLPQVQEEVLVQQQQLTAGEATRYAALLQSYHEVYRADRLQRRTKGPCQDPTFPQLQDIRQRCPQQSELWLNDEDDVLTELRRLADWVRQYRIQQRGGPPSDQLSTNHPYAQDVASPALDDDQAEQEAQDQEILNFYQDTFLDCLKACLQDRVNHCRDKLAEAKQQPYLKSLQLIHCQGLTMTQIAPKVGFQKQWQVSRLVSLKDLRADVRRQVIDDLKPKLVNKVKPFLTPEQLRQLDQRIEDFLGEELDNLLQKDKTNTQTSQKSRKQSRFAHILCQLLDQYFLADNLE